MIWLSYRQARLQLLVGFTALAVVAVVLALTGPHLADLATSENFLSLAAQEQLTRFLAFWTLRWRETGLMLSGTALLTTLTFWRIRQDV